MVMLVIIKLYITMTIMYIWNMVINGIKIQMSIKYILVKKNVANIVRICFSVFRNYLSCACKNRLYTLVDRSFALNDTAQRRQWGLSGGSTVVSNDRAHRRRRQWGLSAGGVEASCACASKQVSKSVSNCTNYALR